MILFRAFKHEKLPLPMPMDFRLSHHQQQHCIHINFTDIACSLTFERSFTRSFVPDKMHSSRKFNLPHLDEVQIIHVMSFIFLIFHFLCQSRNVYLGGLFSVTQTRCARFDNVNNTHDCLINVSQSAI
jgi:hypothetical protein